MWWGKIMGGVRPFKGGGHQCVWCKAFVSVYLYCFTLTLQQMESSWLAVNQWTSVLPVLLCFVSFQKCLLNNLCDPIRQPIILFGQNCCRCVVVVTVVELLLGCLFCFLFSMPCAMIPDSLLWFHIPYDGWDKWQFVYRGTAVIPTIVCEEERRHDSSQQETVSSILGTVSLLYGCWWWRWCVCCHWRRFWSETVLHRLQ